MGYLFSTNLGKLLPGLFLLFSLRLLLPILGIVRSKLGKLSRQLTREVQGANHLVVPNTKYIVEFGSLVCSDAVSEPVWDLKRKSETSIFWSNNSSIKKRWGVTWHLARYVLGNGSLLVFIQLFSSSLILAVSVQLALQKYEGEEPERR